MVIFVVAGLVLGSGCVSTDPISGTEPVGEIGRIELEPPASGIQLHMGPFVVEGQSEVYTCEILQLANDEPLDIVALEHVGSQTLHHFNVWVLLEEPDGGAQEGSCEALWAETSMALASPIYASQTTSFSGEFPEGVAGQLPAEQWVLMEFHALNPDPAAKWTEAYLNATAAEEGTIETYANGLYGTNVDIAMEPGESITTSASCYVDVDMDLIVLGSHFHRHGTLFEIYRLDEDGQADELLYESTDWESPELAFFTDDPIELSAGDG
ncbi:MAG: hypothetical protein QGG40_10425, partial [Myxococcota bacterium]|nr:hypothetical protein [Myxococcota bacterium]